MALESEVEEGVALIDSREIYGSRNECLDTLALLSSLVREGVVDAQTNLMLRRMGKS